MVRDPDPGSPAASGLARCCLLEVGAVALALLLSGCGGSERQPVTGANDTGDGGTLGGPGGAVTGDAGGDPCAGVALPECPPPCSPAAFPDLCGEACAEEGAACSNELGDGMTCTGGTWQCFVHAPPGPGCHLVCRHPEG